MKIEIIKRFDLSWHSRYMIRASPFSGWNDVKYAATLWGARRQMAKLIRGRQQSVVIETYEDNSTVKS